MKIDIKFKYIKVFKHTKIFKYSMVYNNISSVVEFQRWWVLKSKIFA